jgi:hypothetical protein
VGPLAAMLLSALGCVGAIGLAIAVRQGCDMRDKDERQMCFGTHHGPYTIRCRRVASDAIAQ